MKLGYISIQYVNKNINVLTGIVFVKLNSNHIIAFQKHMLFLKNLHSTTQSSTLQGLISEVIKHTNESLILYKELEKQITCRILHNKNDLEQQKLKINNFKRKLVLLDKVPHFNHIDISHHQTDEEIIVHKRFEHNMDAVVSSEFGSFDMLVKLCALQESTVELLALLDSDVVTKFLELTQKPLFEGIYCFNSANMRSNISKEIMTIILKYGIEKLGIAWKAEAELIYDITSLVDKKKVIFREWESADSLFVDFLDPYQDAVHTWIETNKLILIRLKQLNQA